MIVQLCFYKEQCVCASAIFGASNGFIYLIILNFYSDYQSIYLIIILISSDLMRGLFNHCKEVMGDESS